MFSTVSNDYLLPLISVLVGRTGRDCGKEITSEHAEVEIDRIHQLPEVFPELF